MNLPWAKTNVIAIVDDDQPLCEALGSVSKAAGFSVISFFPPKSFFPRRNLQDADCLILDVRLPGMSCIELPRKLLGSSNTMPIIFVSAHGDDSLRNVVLETGASAFLNKPVRSDRHLKEIDAALTE